MELHCAFVAMDFALVVSSIVKAFRFLPMLVRISNHRLSVGLWGIKFERYLGLSHNFLFRVRAGNSITMKRGANAKLVSRDGCSVAANRKACFSK